MKTAFVTGGSGFLGLNLLEQLIEAKWKTLVFDLSAPPEAFVQNEQIEYIQGDITDYAACEEALPDKVDAVFHLAGDTSHWKKGDQRQTRINVDGTRHMVNASLKRKAGKFIYTSSIAAYGFQPVRITEETVSTAENYWLNYFRTKRLAEIEVQKGIKKGLDGVILNPANIIGPYDFSGWSRLFGMINNGKLAGVPPGSATFCHVAEVARAHIMAYEKGRAGHNYLLGGVDASWFEFVQEIGKLLDRKTPKPIPGFILRALGRASQWVSYLTGKEPDLTPEKTVLTSSELICSSKKAIDELGYTPVPLVKMLEDCHDWMIKEQRI